MLPAPGNTAGRGGRPEKHSRRLVLDAIFYLVRGGIAWRQLPVGFPPPTTVYDRFRAWARAGVWQAFHDALRDLVRVYDGRNPEPTAASIDAQSVHGARTPCPGPPEDTTPVSASTDANVTSLWTPAASCWP